MSENTAPKKNINNIYASVFQKKFAAKPSYKGITMIDVSITFPQVNVRENPRTTQRINAFYRENTKKYYDYVSDVLFNQAKNEYIDSIKQHIPFRTFQVVQTFETPYNLNALLSIFYDRYEYTGGAHGNTVRFADTWLLSTANRLKLCDFFEDSYYKSVIFEYIINDISKQIKNGNSYYFDNYSKNVFRYFDESNFYLTDTGFAIYYPLYTIAAYVQGIPVFIVPYDAFGPNLKKRFFH